MKLTAFVASSLILSGLGIPVQAAISATSIPETTTAPSVQSAHQMSDVEKRTRGIPTKTDLKQMTREYLLYDRYEKTLDRLKEHQGYDPASKLNLFDLLDFTRQSCTYLGTLEHGFGEADAFSLAEQSQLATVDEHFGVALAMSVYYRCPRHVDTFHNWMFQLNPE